MVVALDLNYSRRPHTVQSVVSKVAADEVAERLNAVDRDRAALATPALVGALQAATAFICDYLASPTYDARSTTAYRSSSTGTAPTPSSSMAKTAS